MPSVSTTTFVTPTPPAPTTIVQPLGMRIDLIQDYYDSTGKITNSRLLDTTIKDNCCSHPTLKPEDTNPAEEKKLIENFPTFSKAIHELIENRRRYMQAHPNNHSRCVIL